VQRVLSEVGVVVARRSAEFVDVALSNSSITHQKVLRQVGRCSVEDLALLDSLVTVDKSCRTARCGSSVCLHCVQRSRSRNPNWLISSVAAPGD